MKALIQVESKGNPLALGAMIEGTHVSFFPERIEWAAALLQELLTRSTNVDIGLMQINFAVHVRGKGIDATSLLSPEMNTQLGCRILSDALRRSSTLWQGLGRYHSHTPRLMQAYAIRVLQRAKEMSDE